MSRGGTRWVAALGLLPSDQNRVRLNGDLANRLPLAEAPKYPKF